jgi:hypothetical protein
VLAADFFVVIENLFLPGFAKICDVARFETFRNVDDPSEWSSDQWPVAVRREMDAFACALRSNGHQPPVIFFGEYVDCWSMGDLFDRWLSPQGGNQPFKLFADRFQLWCYPLPDGGSLAKQLQHSTRLKRIRQRNPQEERWFTMNLLEQHSLWMGWSIVPR